MPREVPVAILPRPTDVGSLCFGRLETDSLFSARFDHPQRECSVSEKWCRLCAQFGSNRSVPSHFCCAGFDPFVTEAAQRPAAQRGPIGQSESGGRGRSHGAKYKLLIKFKTWCLGDSEFLISGSEVGCWLGSNVDRLAPSFSTPAPPPAADVLGGRLEPASRMLDLPADYVLACNLALGSVGTENGVSCLTVGNAV